VCLLATQPSTVLPKCHPATPIQHGGAREWEIIARHAVPLALPAIVQFLWVYSDLLVAIVFLSGNANTQVVARVLAERNEE
jgi:ABC-type glycerol-3-phosphate transport system permease component